MSHTDINQEAQCKALKDQCHLHELYDEFAHCCEDPQPCAPSRRNAPKLHATVTHVPDNFDTKLVYLRRPPHNGVAIPGTTARVSGSRHQWDTLGDMHCLPRHRDHPHCFAVHLEINRRISEEQEMDDATYGGWLLRLCWQNNHRHL